LSLRRQLGVSLLVQGTGSAALLLATLWLGAKLGPEQQGAFSHTKAEIEFVAAFAMFGLPQALFYFVKSARLGRRAALRWAAGSGLLALSIGAVYAAVQQPRGGAVAVAALAIAVAVSVFHGQLRSLLLVGRRTEWFNLATAWPQFVVLFGVFVVVALGAANAQRWPWLFALAFGSAAVLALWRLRAAPGAPATAPEAGWRELGHYGLAAWLTAALSTAAVLLVQRWVGSAQGAAVLGVFTMAMTLVQLPLTPVNYAAPLLFRRWMERPGARASQRWAVGLFAALFAVALLVWFAATLWPRLGLGPGYAGLAQALAVLLVGGAAEAASRVLGVNANAAGTPWVAARAEAARWLVLGAGWLAPVPASLLPMCALWSAAALAAAAVFAFESRGGAQRAEAVA